jgi:hypothetical protein
MSILTFLGAVFVPRKSLPPKKVEDISIVSLPRHVPDPVNVLDYL